MIKLFTAIGSPAFPTPRDQLEQRIRLGLQRANTGSGVSRQLAAIMADGDRTPMLRQLQLRTLVLHGEADRMVPVRHARQLVRAIPGAALETIAGWGHDLPDALADRLSDRIAQNARRD
jgi:pimeloyl-ACP methyl ester carboxylesterase